MVWDYGTISTTLAIEFLAIFWASLWPCTVWCPATVWCRLTWITCYWYSLLVGVVLSFFVAFELMIAGVLLKIGIVCHFCGLHYFFQNEFYYI